MVIFDFGDEYQGEQWVLVRSANARHSRGAHSQDDWNVLNDLNDWNPKALKPQRAATFARVGAADEGSWFGVNHDRVGAAEAFRIAANDLVAAAG